MGLTKYKLGELIEQTEEINSQLIYGTEDVRGMTIIIHRDGNREMK